MSDFVIKKGHCVGPCGFLRFLVGPCGSLRVPAGPCGSLRVPKKKSKKLDKAFTLSRLTVGRYLFFNSRPCTDTLLAQSTPPASLGRVVHKRTFISKVSVVFSNPLSMQVEYRVSLIFVATHSNPVDSKSIILASHLDRAFIFSGNVNK